MSIKNTTQNSSCAWLRDGYCLMHKEDCGCISCTDMVRKVRHHQLVTLHRESHPHRREFNLLSAKGRLQRRMYGVERGIVYSACFGKKRYSTENRAKEVRRSCIRSGAEYIRIYHCRWCNGYHLTSKPYHEGGMINVA